MSDEEFTDSIERMMEDPALRGNTLAFAIALTHELRMQALWGRSRKRHDGVLRVPDVWLDAAWLLVPDDDAAGARILLKSILREDAPRYQMRYEKFGYPCTGTMLRPAGAPCRHHATRTGSIPNPFTGERRWAGSCSNPRHVAAFEAESKAGWDAWRANGSPEPANNTGGHLMRYFDSDWVAMYSWASGQYKPAGGVPEPDLPRARLAVVLPFCKH